MTESPLAPGQSDRIRGLLRSFFSNPWIGFLGSICSVVGVGLAVYFYFGGARTRRLTYAVNPVKTIVVKGGETSALRVLHGDQEVKGDVTAAQVAIWNGGSESIRPENILGPVRLVLHPPAAILEASVRKASRGVIGASLDTSRLAVGIINVTWKILERNDGAVIQLIFAGPAQTDIEVEGIVEGQPTVFRLEPPTEKTTSDRWLTRVEGIFGLFVLCLFVWWNWHRRRSGEQLGRFDRIVPWVLVLTVSMWVVGELLELRQLGPPFGF